MELKYAYYARCMAIYGTKQEDRDKEFIHRKMGYFIIPFPSQDLINKRKREGENVMETLFKPLVLSASILFFRALPDLKIPSGVGLEVQWAKEAGIPVLELPTRTQYRTMCYADTVEYLREV